MANFVYKESRVVTKKFAGEYNAETHIVNVDGEEKNIIDELKSFDKNIIEIVVKTKEETDLSDDVNE